MAFHPSNCTHPRSGNDTGSCSSNGRKGQKIKKNPEHTARRPKPYKKRRSTLGPISLARLKGERSESSVLEILKVLIKRKILPEATEEVKRYPANSPEDKAGWDIAYVTDLGPINLQVKSSWRSREKFLRKHPTVICIVVEDPEDEDTIVAQLMVDILRVYGSMQY